MFEFLLYYILEKQILRQITFFFNRTLELQEKNKSWQLTIDQKHAQYKYGI